MNQEGRLILASASKRRQELLKGLGLDFDIMPSHIEEKITGEEPVSVVQELALAKAQAVWQNLPSQQSRQAFVLSADTLVAIEGSLLGKPSSRQEAYEMLMKLSGRCHEVFTGVALVKATLATTLCEISKVYFRKLDPQEVKFYVGRDEPMDKAGAYALQGMAACFVEKIAGCYTNVIGLPLPATVNLLRHHGFKVLGISLTKV